MITKLFPPTIKIWSQSFSSSLSSTGHANMQKFCRTAKIKSRLSHKRAATHHYLELFSCRKFNFCTMFTISEASDQRRAALRNSHSRCSPATPTPAKISFLSSLVAAGRHYFIKIVIYGRRAQTAVDARSLLDAHASSSQGILYAHRN